MFHGVLTLSYIQVVHVGQALASILERKQHTLYWDVANNEVGGNLSRTVKMAELEQRRA